MNSTLIAQILNFLILVFILAKFAYNPICKALDARKAKIAEDLGAAEKAKEDAEAVKAEYAAKLADAKAEAEAIIENAHKTAEAVREKIMADTEAEKEQIIAAAKESIAMEQKKSMDAIRTQVVDLSMAVAGKIVEEKLGTEEVAAIGKL